MALFLFASFPDIYHNFKDRLAWADMKSMLKGKYVVSVELFGLGSQNVVLDPSNKEKILDSLQKAKFKESNWRKHGPTPDIVVILKFNDGLRESFSYWGGRTFEISYKDSQFLISGLDLETIVNIKALVKDGRLGNTSDIGSIIEQKLEAILHEPSVSSNPYTFVKNSSEFAEIVQMGRPALEYLLDKFENTTSDGLEEYVMAIACAKF